MRPPAGFCLGHALTFPRPYRRRRGAGRSTIHPRARRRGGWKAHPLRAAPAQPPLRRARQAPTGHADVPLVVTFVEVPEASGPPVAPPACVRGSTAGEAFSPPMQGGPPPDGQGRRANAGRRILTHRAERRWSTPSCPVRAFCPATHSVAESDTPHAGPIGSRAAHYRDLARLLQSPALRARLMRSHAHGSHT